MTGDVTGIFPANIVSAATAIHRYERMSSRPRSARAWKALATRFRVAAAYARYRESWALGDALIDLANECSKRARNELATVAASRLSVIA